MKTIYHPKINHFVRNLLSLFLFLLCFDISAQKSLNIKVLNSLKAIKPGEPFSLFIEVRSNEVFNNKIEMELLMPESFQLLMTKKPLIFKGEESVKYIYTVNTSNFLSSGIYNLGIKAYGDGYEEEIENQSIEISRVRKLDILNLDIPEYVKAGDTLKTEFIVQNSGNNPEKITLKSMQGKVELPKVAGDSIKLDSVILKVKTKKKKVIKEENRIDSLTVAPNATVRVKVIQVVPESVQSSWNLAPNLEVFMTDSLRPISKTVSIPVFSSTNKKIDPYLRFPIEIGGSYNSFKFGDSQLSGFQYDIRGKGDLDFARKHYLDFTIHGPNQFNLPSIGTFDVYSAEYNYKKRTNIIVGDYNLRMNNLMEFGRFGRGFKYDQSTKKIDFSIFYISPRFFPFQKDTYGGVFTIKPSEKYHLSLNYLYKTVVDVANTSDVQLVGITNKIRIKNFLLENEVAKSFGQSQNGFGVFNRVDWQKGRFRINSNLIYASKGFQGFYNNSFLLINNLNYGLSKKMGLFLNSNITRLNPNFDQTVLIISPYSQDYTLGFNYQLFKMNNLFIGYETREREDRSSLKSFSFSEKYGRLTYTINAPKFTLYAEGRLGTSQNLLVKVDSSANQRLLQTVLQPQVKMLPWLWLGGYFNYQRTSSFSNDNRLQDFYFYGGSAKLIFSNVFTGNINFRNNYAPDELVEKRSFLDINLNLNLGKHEFSFSGGKSFIPTFQGNNQNVEFYSIKYKLRINAPIARNKKLSSIKGQILGLSDKINTKGMVVELGGRKYMTDASGSFQFNDLLPDRYFVNIVSSSMGTGIVSTVKNPLEVVVKADTNYKIEIPLVKTGDILGKINFKKSESVGAIDITQQKPIVLVKLFNDKDRYLTQVNDKDEFAFKEIKPGKWKISASTPGKVDQFSILNIDDTIELESEQSKSTIITIVAKERKVFFSNKTHSLSTNKPKK